MCLIITGPAHKVRSTLLNTEGLLLDIFKTNPDGIGIMYGSKGRLKVVKRMPGSLDAAKVFIGRMPTDGRLLAVHFRWTTHGHTNLENCHPYSITDDVAMMHNGVISKVGNSKDTSRSDTWHFIQDYLKEAVESAPILPFQSGFATLVSEFVGTSNKLVFMDRDGRMMIINKKQGFEHEDLWFSNTYAWTPKLLVSDYKGYSSNYGSRGRGGYYNGGYGEWGDSEWGEYGYPPAGSYNPAGQRTGGGQSSGPKSGVQHNVIALPDGQQTGRSSTTPTSVANAGPSSSVASGSTHGSGASSGGGSHTKADEQAEAEWEKAIQSAHREWVRDQRTVHGNLQNIRDGKGVDVDAPEEGAKEQERATESGIVTVSAPTRSELIEALTDANVDAFTEWLAGYPQVTLALLFHLYKAAPTKWTKGDDLVPYEQLIYDACIAGDKRSLLAECLREDASSAVVAEVICFYLNWYAWPEVDVDPRAPNPFPQGASDTTSSGGSSTSSKDDSHVDSGAQLGQGGESLDGADNAVYVG